MLPFLIVEHQFMKNSNRSLQYKIAMAYTSRALLYKMSVKLKKTLNSDTIRLLHVPRHLCHLLFFLWCKESASSSGASFFAWQRRARNE